MPSASRLADLPKLGVGEIGIEPSLLELTGPLGRRVLEPRVMQVMVALAKAPGRTVARDDLIDECWAGRAVSDDAINRAIAKLRDAMAAVGGRAVMLETIRGIGYRLVLAEKPSPARQQEIIPAIDLETRALGAMFEGTALGTATAIRYLEQAVGEAPAQPFLLGSLAMAYILHLPFAGERVLMVAARARQAALRAQQLQPDEGRSLAALVSLEPTFGAWQAKDRMLTDMLARAPAGTAPLLFQRVLFLASVGRMAEALAIVTPLAVAAPLVPWIQSARAHALAATGEHDEGLDIARRAHRRWPANRLCWFTYFCLSLHCEQVGETLSLLDQGRGEELSPCEFEFASEVARARAAPSLAQAPELIVRFEQAFADRQSRVEQAVMGAALLHLPNEAVRLLQRLYFDRFDDGRESIAYPKIGLLGAGERNTAILFLAPLAEVRSRPEFKQLLDAIELPVYADLRRCREDAK